jgi:hypothetical protein
VNRIWKHISLSEKNFVAIHPIQVRQDGLALKLKLQPWPKESAETNAMTMERDGFSHESPRGNFHLGEQFHQLISRSKNYLSMHEPKRSAMGIST